MTSHTHYENYRTGKLTAMMKSGEVTDVNKIAKRGIFWRLKFCNLLIFFQTGGRKCLDCSGRRDKEQECCSKKRGEGGNTCWQKGADKNLRERKKLKRYVLTKRCNQNCIAKLFTKLNFSTHFPSISWKSFYFCASRWNCLQQRLFWTKSQLNNNSLWRRKSMSLKRWFWSNLADIFLF